MYKSIDPAKLDSMLAEVSPLQLIDVRSTEEFVRGAIAGAQHIELAALPARREELDADAPVIVYCLSGARSAQACIYLAQQGFSDLYHLEGGIAAWARAGLPVTG
jgi:rhodanese-related sulfurtransferase